jgi:hypothetical protein
VCVCVCLCVCVCVSVSVCVCVCAQPLAEQAANDEGKLSLFATTFVARTEELELNVGAPTYAAAQHYLEVARSTPCFVRLLAATGPPSRHGRCSHCSVMIWM